MLTESTSGKCTVRSIPVRQADKGNAHSFPVSLVQIHYHDRIGGVRQVIERYAAHFRAVAGENAENCLICARSATPAFPDVHCIDLPEADYHHFFSEAAFNRAVECLTSKLLKVLYTFSSSGPVAVIGHNLCLGKNPALSAAFARCASLLDETGDRTYRFFSVLHDFPYGGRAPSLLNRTTDPRQENFPLEKHLFAVGAPVHFIVPSETGASTTGLQSHECSVVPDPLDFTPSPHRKARIHSKTAARRENKSGSVLNEQLTQLAAEHEYRYDATLPLYCYPSRMIHRKNLFEALLLVTVLMRGTLVTGGAGRLAADRQRMKIAQRLSRRYNLSFVPAVLSVVSPQGGDIVEPFGPVIEMSQFCVSTSCAEGFGYSLFSPWYFGRSVVGRMPSGTSLLGGMKVAGLYTRLPVPVEWISIREAYDYLARTYAMIFRKRYQSLRRFAAEVIIDETIDFAVLNSSQQVAVIKHAAENPLDCRLWRLRLQASGRGWPGLPALLERLPGEVDRNRNTVVAWGSGGFRNTFVNCLSRIPVPPADSRWYRAIERYYADPAVFRPYF